jgi:hypothetical protein
MSVNYLGQAGIVPVFAKYGVLFRKDGTGEPKPVLGAFFDENQPEADGLFVDFAGDQLGFFPIEGNGITTDEKTGTISFESYDNEYTIRELREEDGVWLSDLRVPLSVEILDTLIDQLRRNNPMNYLSGGEGLQEESLEARAANDSAYIVGLLYSNDSGTWARIDGDWALLSPTDETYEDTVVIEIDPDKASEFIKMFDDNYITVTDAEQYELLDEDQSTEE